MTIDEYIEYIKENNEFYQKDKNIATRIKEKRLQNLSSFKKLCMSKKEQIEKKEPVMISNLSIAHMVKELNPELDIKIYAMFDSSIQIEIPSNVSTLKLPTNLFVKNSKIYDKNSNFLVHIKRS